MATDNIGQAFAHLSQAESWAKTTAPDLVAQVSIEIASALLYGLLEVADAIRESARE